MTYGDFKGLPRKAASDKILCNKAFNIAKNLKYDGYERGLASMVYRLFDKKSSDGAVRRVRSEFLATQDKQDKSAIENKIVSNQQLAGELHKPIIRKFEKRKVYSPFKDNI